MATSASVGALSVEITANIKGLKTSVKKAGDVLKIGRENLNKNAKTWAKWGVGIATAHAVAAAAIFKTTSSNIKELKALSFAANEVTAEFQRGAFAAQRFGIEQDKFGDILKDVNDRIGDFTATGGGEMKEFFEKIAPQVGITAEAFKGLSGQESLGLYVKTLEDANLSQAEMTFFMESMASDSTRLLPLFRDNAKLLKQFSDEAKQLGIGLSEIDIAKVTEANRQLSAVGGLIQNTVQAAVVELSPLVTALAKEFTNAAKEAGGLGKTARTAFDNVIMAVGFVLDSVDGVSRVFEALGKLIAVSVLGWELSFHKIGNAFWAGLGEKIEAAIELWNDLPFTDEIEFSAFNGIVEQTQEAMNLTTAAIDAGLSDIAAILDRPMPSEGLKKAVQEAREASEALAQIAEEDRIAAEAGDFVTSGAGNGKVEALSEETAKILEEMQKRFQSERELEDEKFVLEDEALRAALGAKQITKSEFDELDQQLKQEHKDTLADIDAQAARVEIKQITGTMSAAATIISLGGKKTEKAVRALAIVSAIIKGQESAVAAYAAGMSIGGPAAPALAALYAAASVAQTGMMIAKLKSGSKGSARPSGGTPRVASGGGGGNNGDGQGNAQRRFDLTLVGSGMFTSDQVRGLMAQIGEEVGDGVEFNVIQG